MTTTETVTRAEYCAIACADIFAGAGEIMASPMATLPQIGRASCRERVCLLV